MRKVINHFLIFIILCFVHCAHAQQKFEKEYRLKTQEVPSLARQFVDSLDFDRRVKWYMEISQDGKSVEAKSKRNGQRYSIEFDSTGILQDVEIEVRFGTIPEKLRETITQNLDVELDRFRITKTQEQLTGARKDLLTYLKGGPDKTALTTRYEAIVRGTKDGERNEFEYTFSLSGEIEKSSKVVFRNTDNLVY